MKLGILTQPLHSNYGGLLQAWALQRILTEMGHETWIIRREFPRMKDIPILSRTISGTYHRLMQILGREKVNIIINECQQQIIRKNTNCFIGLRYTHLTPLLYTDSQLRDFISKANFRGYIVGSDQVWRPSYSPALSNYFLDFAKGYSKIIRVAYAASFGTDDWELNSNETKKALSLAHLFDLITVRESSAVGLVKDHLGCKAYHVLDPTMLLEKKDYEQLVENSTCSLSTSNGGLFCYVLDPTEKVQNVIEECVERTNLKPYDCYAKRRIKSEKDLEFIEECIMPPVEQWIKSFIDAKMVVTDSFHGTAFSIIFNKPFWVVANEKRGVARFTSLLSLFGLENRIITLNHSPNWQEPIDWNLINIRWKEFQRLSIQLLTDGLLNLSVK